MVKKVKDELKTTQTAQVRYRTGLYGEHPSKGLTPARLHRILESAEQGDITAQHELFCDIEEKDGHILAEMSKRKNALLKLDWRIKPPKNPSEAEKTFTEEVADWLDCLELDPVILDLADAIGHGFSALELSWQQANGVWLPGAITHQPQSWFMFTETDELRLRTQTPGGDELWAYGWLIHHHRARSGQNARMGLFRTLAWTYLFKNYSVRDLAELLEIYGIPVRIGKYPGGSSDADKAALLRAVTEIGHNAGGIMPDNMAIEFAQASAGSVQPFDTFIRWCEKTASKVILGGTLTTDGDSKTSTNALGVVHNEVRHDILVSDARQLEVALNKLIQMLVQLNRPAQALRAPTFSFDIKNPEQMTLYADLITKAVAMGVKVPAAWAHEKLDIPQPADDEEVLNAVQTPVKTTDTAALAALKSEPAILPKSIKSQLVLDEIIDSISTDELTDQITPIVSQITTALSRANSYDEAQTIIANLYESIDSPQFNEAMERALFVSDSWGRLNANG